MNSSSGFHDIIRYVYIDIIAMAIVDRIDAETNVADLIFHKKIERCAISFYICDQFSIGKSLIVHVIVISLRLFHFFYNYHPKIALNMNCVDNLKLKIYNIP